MNENDEIRKWNENVNNNNEEEEMKIMKWK